MQSMHSILNCGNIDFECFVGAFSLVFMCKYVDAITTRSTFNISNRIIGMGKSKIKSNQRNLERNDDQIYTVRQQQQHSQQQLIQRNVFVVHNLVVYFFVVFFCMFHFFFNFIRFESQQTNNQFEKIEKWQTTNSK